MSEKTQSAHIVELTNRQRERKTALDGQVYINVGIFQGGVDPFRALSHLGCPEPSHYA